MLIEIFSNDLMSIISASANEYAALKRMPADRSGEW